MYDSRAYQHHHTCNSICVQFVFRWSRKAGVLCRAYASVPGFSMADDVSGVFNDYENDFNSRLDACKRSISSSRSDACSCPEAVKLLDAAGRDLEEAHAVLQSMSLEISSLSSSARDRVGPAVSRYRSNASKVRSDLRLARIELAKRRGDEDRSALLDGAAHDSDIEAGESDQKHLLSKVTSKLEESSERLLASRRNIAQTETLGASILEDLQNQRATIMRARGNLGGVDEGLEQSSNILTSMNRRALVNRLVIYAVFAIIALACLWIVYTKLFRS